MCIRDRIDTVDSFVALSKKVEFAEGNSVELPDFGEPRTCLLYTSRCV